jgi:integrase
MSIESVNERLAHGQGWIGHRNNGERQSKNLYFSFRRDGKQVFINTKSTDPEEAYRQLLEARGATERGVSVLPSEATRLTYQHLRDKYTESRGFKKDEEPGQIKHIDAFFGHLKATSITHNVIDKYIAKRQKDGIAGPTIRRELNFLRAMFHEARKRKMISADHVPYFSMPKDSDGAAQYIDPATFIAIREHLPNGKSRGAEKGGPKSDTNLQPLFNFLYATACRLGVATTIPWAWVSKDNTSIKIPVGITKNDEALTLSLKGAFLAPLRDWMAKQDRVADKPVFDSRNHRTEWAKACAAAGFGTVGKQSKGSRSRTGFRIHDCRASAAVNLLDSGVPENVVLRIGGWKSREMLDRYAKLTSSRAHAAMETSGDYIQKLADLATSQ